MLGIFLASLLTPKAGIKGLTLGFFISFALVAYIRPDFYQILINFDLLTLEKAVEWSFLEAKEDTLKPIIHTAWAWPLTVFITWGAGAFSPKRLIDDLAPQAFSSSTKTGTKGRIPFLAKNMEILDIRLQF